jgi:hypothetical protein
MRAAGVKGYSTRFSRLREAFVMLGKDLEGHRRAIAKFELQSSLLDFVVGSLPRSNITGERQHTSSTLRSFLERWTSLASGIIPTLNHDSRYKKSGY